MRYLLDTVTIIRHLTNSGTIGKKAGDILNKEDIQNTFVISVISLMEILYLSERKRIAINLKETLSVFQSSSLYTVVDLTPDILKVAQDITFPELHVRLLLSTAKWLGIPILSSDRKFSEVKNIEVIWN
jgi:PIN domain nuclease of toxin-antitoxin system